MSRETGCGGMWAVVSESCGKRHCAMRRAVVVSASGYGDRRAVMRARSDLRDAGCRGGLT